MQTQTLFYTAEDGWSTPKPSNNLDASGLVLAFGSLKNVESKTRFKELQGRYPKADIVLCSTAGEILETQVNDDTLAVTAIKFKSTSTQTVMVKRGKTKRSADLGAEIVDALPTKNLTHVMVFAEGLNINGSHLVEGMMQQLPEGVQVTGGLAGDGGAFKRTAVGLNGPAISNQIVAVGFYGEKLQVGFGSVGGWDEFGVERIVTKSKNNVVYELDGQPILPLYKKYLGPAANDLPGSGLFFPLSVHAPDSDIKLVRTLLAVDEEVGSITFAGNVPEGHMAQLMKANFDRLIDGAGQAAQATHTSLKGKKAELAVLVSCVGRKLVLKQRIEEEVESVQAILGDQCHLTGFYSYGEIAPTAAEKNQCRLHNQTMTITTFQERA